MILRDEMPFALIGRSTPSSLPPSIAEIRAFARDAVRAVNAHDALVTALRGLLLRASELAEPGPHAVTLGNSPEYVAARAALAAVEVKP
jgi:hypothetical protein